MVAINVGLSLALTQNCEVKSIVLAKITRD